MSKIIYVEVINDDEVRIYQNNRFYIVKNEDLTKFVSYQWVLFDSLHVSAKTFEHEVKNKNVLLKVIESSMEEFLIKPVNQYQFSHKIVNHKLWVIWIEKEQIEKLKQRFASFEKNIITLTSLPLFYYNYHQDSGVIKNAPFAYAFWQEETLTVRVEQSHLFDDNNLNIIETIQDTHPAFDNDSHYKSLPSLWQNHKTRHQLNTAWLLILPILLMVLMILNQILDYQNVKSNLQQIEQAQLKSLQTIFPDANTPDPYGRLKAEYKTKHSDLSYLNQLNDIFSHNPSTISSLDIDIQNKQIIINGELSNQLINALKDNGFKLSQSNMETILTW